MEEKHFKNDAKQIVDMAFDAKLFKENVTRDDMNTFEDLIEFLLQSKFDTYKKCLELTAKIQKIKTHE